MAGIWSSGHGEWASPLGTHLQEKMSHLSQPWMGERGVLGVVLLRLEAPAQSRPL